jgi:DNA repair protein RecN (Recombination protein N)
MLSQLRIRDFAIIEEMAVEFGPGLNVLTGETGAGKSILIEALHLLLGGRARTDVIRSGAEEAAVEAIFEPGPRLAERLRRFDLEARDGLLIRRVVSRGGKNRIAVNGSPLTLGLLEELALDLVDITGQHEHHSLLRTETHLEVLDDFGELWGGRQDAAQAYDRMVSLRREREELERDERERAVREDFLTFQVQEIRSAELQPGEEEALQTERARLRHAERLLAATAGGEEALYAADGAAASVLAKVERELSDLGAIDPELGTFVERLRTARLEVEDVARSLGLYARGLAADPARLAEVEERLALCARLKRKYGGTVEEVLATGEGLAAELERISSTGTRLATIDVELAAQEQTLAAACRTLSEARARAARRLEEGVTGELRSLAFEDAQFQVQQVQRPATEEGVTVLGARAGPKGIDRVEFLFAPNRGEEARPLSRIVSGGELSRVTLALKMVLAAGDPVGTYVFDEVDSGLGGGAGEVVGRKLKLVSRQRQVLCVTHLAPIAAFADRHYRVSKRVTGGRTISLVTELDEAQRTQELARMLGGVKVTDEARAHAREIIRSAR